MYSKRERKPRIWSDFETEAAAEGQSDKGKAGKQDKENGTTEKKLAKKDTLVKKDVANSVTSVKKGRRKSQKLASKITEAVSIQVDNGKDSAEKASKDVEEAPITEGATKLSASESKNEESNEIKSIQSNEMFEEDLDTEVKVSHEEMKSLKEAVESKRTTKYIEKCDRVIERLDKASIQDNMASIKDEAMGKIVSESIFSKGIKNSDLRTSSPTSDVKKSVTQKKTPGKKRGRPKKSVIEEINSEPMELKHNPKFINDVSEIGCVNESTDLDESIRLLSTPVSGDLDESARLLSTPVIGDLDERARLLSTPVSGDLDESARLLNTPVSAPVRKRAKQKTPEEVYSPLGVMSENNFETPVTAPKRRGRKKKVATEETDDIDKDLNISQGSSRKGRIRKEINYAALEDDDDGSKEESGDLKVKNLASEETIEIDKELNVSQGSSRKGRKRKEINYAALENDDGSKEESEELKVKNLASEETNENNKELNVSQGSSRKGRKRKEVNYVSLDDGNDLKEESGGELNTSQGSSRKGRKRKEINYAALEDGDDLNDKSREHVTKKRSRKRKAANDGDVLDESLEQSLDKSYDQLDEEADDHDDDFCVDKKTPSRKISSNMAKSLQCHHCEYVGKSVNDITKHYAISHQLWWTIEKPEGSFDKSCWPKVFKLKKFLNCTKCDKQINFVTYYPNHFEWCGREHLTYTCEHCQRHNLILRWQQLHIKTCPALMAKISMEKRKQDSERRKEEQKLQVEIDESGRKRKRKAAKKAISMVHDISKEMEPSAHSDDSCDDPDVVLGDYDHDDDDDDEIDDDDINEDDLDTPDEDIDDDDNDDNGGGYTGIGINPTWQRVSNFNPISLMEKFIEETWSEQLFLDWLPRKQDWKLLSQEESEPYLPKMKSSMRFCFHKGDTPSTLDTLQATTIHGFPMFYTGLVVWDMVWCPTTLKCTDGQFLAVTGKTDHSQEFLTDQRWVGPGLIQIWYTGIESNKLKTEALPKLHFNLVHDYGLVTKMLWCPSGCYKTNENQTEANSYTRLGLLAVCFTDGSCRIFSVPLFSATSDEEVQTYKASPVITLRSYNDYEGGSYTCSAIDWLKTKGHSKVVLGYSNGAVKLYNLLSTSPLQRLTIKNEACLIPHLSLQPHGNLIRAIQFCSLFEHIIVSSSEDFETVFHDITNLGSPIHSDSGTFMTTCMVSSLWQHGVFVGPDENYAVLANKARYIESGHVLFTGQQIHRKDEKGAYYVSSQPACIWDIECSEWTGFVVSCDNRGCISGLMLKDFLKMSPDCKSYRHRQILLRTIIAEDKTTEEDNETNKNSSNTDQSEQCKKCTIIQSAHTLYNDKSVDDQSETSVQCTCGKADQSACRKELSNENQCSIKNESTIDTVNAVKAKAIQNYQNLVNNSVLQFEENFMEPKFCPYDKNSDKYDRPFVAAIKSVSFNPNNHQCCWLAYGGSTGLVRLVNVQKILYLIIQNDLRRKHQI